MAILDYDLDSIPEITVAPADNYDLRIKSAGDHQGPKGMSIKVVLEILDAPDAPDIFHYISLPNDNDDEKSKDNKLRRLRDFIIAFGVDNDTDTWTGATGRGAVEVQAAQGSFPESNRIKTLYPPQ